MEPRSHICGRLASGNVGIDPDIHADDPVPASGSGGRVHKECPREDRQQNEHGCNSCVFDRFSCRPDGLKRSKPATSGFGLNGPVCEIQQLPALEKFLVPFSPRKNFADPFHQSYFEQNVGAPSREPAGVNNVARIADGGDRY